VAAGFGAATELALIAAGFAGAAFFGSGFRAGAVLLANTMRLARAFFPA
jgi:hypothetical protein